METPVHLFVYGTLRESASHPMHRLLQPATRVGPGRFQGRLYDLGRYPGAVASDDPADVIHGEVYRLHDPVPALERLDRYEGCGPADSAPQEYVRAIVKVRLDTGEAIPAHLYLYARPVEGLTRIEPGDYLAWTARLSSPQSGR